VLEIGRLSIYRRYQPRTSVAPRHFRKATSSALTHTCRRLHAVPKSAVGRLRLLPALGRIHTSSAPRSLLQFKTTSAIWSSTRWVPWPFTDTDLSDTAENGRFAPRATEGSARPRVGVRNGCGGHFMVPPHLTYERDSSVEKAPAHGAVGRCPAALRAFVPGWVSYLNDRFDRSLEQ